MNWEEINEEIEQVVQMAEDEYGNWEEVRGRILDYLSQGLEIEEAIEKTSWELYQ